MYFYKFKSKSLLEEFKSTCESNRLLVEDITQFDEYPWYTVFSLSGYRDKWYINNKMAGALHFTDDEVDRYLEKFEKATPTQGDLIKPVVDDKTVEIEPKYQININGLFTEDEVRKLIDSLEEKL